MEQLPASGHLLHGPTVAVRIAEEDEGAPVEFLDVTHLDPALDELRTRGVDVRDDQLQALHGARPHVAKPSPQGDRASRPGRRELDEANLIADLVVMVRMEPGLVG